MTHKNLLIIALLAITVVSCGQIKHADMETIPNDTEITVWTTINAYYDDEVSKAEDYYPEFYETTKIEASAIKTFRNFTQTISYDEYNQPPITLNCVVIELKK